MSTFQQNLQALQKINPTLAQQLSTISTNTIYEIFLPENANEKELNLVDTRDNTPLYQTSPTSEIKERLKEFKKFTFYPALYFFGLGNGYFYKKLLENKHHESILVVEPELELLYITLNFIDFSKEILERRLILEHISNIDQNYCIILLHERLKLFLKVYDLHVHSDYYEKYFEDIKHLHQSFIGAFKYLTVSMGNSATDGTIGLEHSLKNFQRMLHSPTLKMLKQQASTTKTAIIVSTGPSLAKQLPLLKKIQEYVTILSIDASLPILSKEGIKPDIVFSIERVKESSQFYKQTPKEFHHDIIFALASVVHQETIDSIHGTMSIFLRNDTYNMFFGLDEWGYLSGGMSAANFTYDFATQCDFEQIVLIGQDLAYGEDGSSHAKNHVFGEDEIKKEKTYIQIPAYGGEKMVPTTRIWKSFLDSYVFQIENSSIPTINATEGGAKIHGTLEKSFKSVCEKILKTTKQKERITLELLSQNKREMIQQNYYKKLEYAIKMGEKVSKLAHKAHEKSAQFLKKVEDYSDKQLLENISLNELSLYVNNINKVNKMYKKEDFLEMYSLLLQAYVMTVEFDICEVYVMPEETELAIKKKKVAWIRVHQTWLSRIEENLTEILKVLKKSHASLQDELLEMA